MGTLLGEATLSEMILPFWKGIYSKRKEFAPKSFLLVEIFFQKELKGKKGSNISFSIELFSVGA